ncbi:MAG: ankyrin repeat domain-containing protein [Myxococcales bacterium]|nr:ankyrin repeat domain-containing protein [Myxococcales bacterium]
MQAAIASVLAAQQAPWFERLAAHADVRRRVAALTPADQLAVAIDLGDLARLERLARAAPGAVTPALLTQAVEKRSTTSRVAIVERLLAASPGADLRTLLRTAISAASPGMVRVLLHHGADVAPDPATGATPLAAARDVETARLLIAAGVSARIADHAGRTALHFAGSVDVVRVLLSAGADARVVDATGGDRAAPRARRGGDRPADPARRRARPRRCRRRDAADAASRSGEHGRAREARRELRLR